MGEFDEIKQRFDELLKSTKKSKVHVLTQWYKIRKITNDSQIAIIEDNNYFFVYKIDFVLKTYHEQFGSPDYYQALEYFCDMVIDQYTTSYSKEEFETVEW